MPFVRVMSKQDPDGELGPVELVLRVDDAGNPEGNGRVFGAMGDPQGSSYWPFAMSPEGTVDFGSGEGLERDDNFDILNRNIAIGECWTYHNTPSGEEYAYRITAIDPLNGA